MNKIDPQLYMDKTAAAQRATATDPERANLLRAAELCDGEGASEGGEEIVDGVVSGAGEVAGEFAREEAGVDDVGGAGGEFSVAREGETAGEEDLLFGEGAEAGVFAGGVADGGDLVGDEAGEGEDFGEDAGD